MTINVAIDGPSGAGKSTIAKAVAAKLGYIYVDTGALYRSIACYMITNNIDTKNTDKVISALPNITIDLKYIDGVQHVYLNSIDVSDKIRTPEVSMGASAVSAIPSVRQYLLELQRNIALNNNIIMDGRDIGTVILPDADVKIFLTASSEKRAERRCNELLEKGMNVTYENVLKEMIERDSNDSSRETAPLVQASDAIKIDTSDMTLNQSIDYVYRIVSDKINTVGTIRKKKGPVKIFLYSILRAIVNGIFHIYYKLEFIGKENIPHEGSIIFASNHRSYTDPVLLAIPTRVPFNFMAKEELFQGNKLFKVLIKMFGAFPVARGKGDFAVIDESIKRLNNGNNLAIFPEGTRSKDGTVGKGKSGVALIAAKAQVPVVPVGICFKGKLKFRSRVIVAFGKPISPSELQISSFEPREIKKIKTRIMSEITSLVDENVNRL